MNPFSLTYFIFSFLIVLLSSCSSFKDEELTLSLSPKLSWSDKVFDFGNQYLGANASSSFQMTNKGKHIASQCGPIVLSDTTNFSVLSTTCLSPDMQPQESCSVEIQANPQSAGFFNLSVKRECAYNNSLVSPELKISINAAVGPQMAWSSMSHSFGANAVGSSSAEQIFTLTNSGVAAATGCGLASISDATNFAITDDQCGLLNLGIAQSCQIKIKANPTSAGLKQMTLSRTCAVGGIVQTSTDQITTTGTAPNLAWSPLINDFGTVVVGANSSTQSFTLTNSGSASATSCSTPAISDTTNFTITSNTCGTTDVAVSGSCTVNLRAHPTSAGLKSATLSRTCFSGGTITTSANQITASGLVLNTDFAWDQESWNFGNVGVNETSQIAQFQLLNSNGFILTGCSAPVLSDNVNFEIQSNGCSTDDLPAYDGPDEDADKCAVFVRARPQSLGLKTTTLSRFCLNGGTASTITNQIVATGVTPVPNISFSPQFKVFGDIGVDFFSPTQIFTLTNTGTGAATSCSAPILSDIANFTITSDTCGTANLNIGASCDVVVRANPASTGLKTATLSRSCTVGGTVSTTSDGITTTGTPTMYPNWVQEYSLSSLGLVRSTATTSSLFKYYFRNTSGSALTGCTAAAVSNTTDFSIISDTCTSTLSGYGICEVQVKANLVSTGLRTSNLSRSCTKSGTVTANLTATGELSTEIVTQVAAGANHSCALLSTGRIKCWGYNATGGLGDGTTTERLLPVMVSDITTAAQVEVGSSHTCARLSDGTIKCWGSGTSGRLGNGGTSHSSTPVSVLGISNAAHLAVAGDFACAALLNGTVKCWGMNDFSQLGDGTTDYQSTPVLVPGLSNVIQVGAADNHSCALIDDGYIKCWGNNGNGRLGDGTSISRTTPVTVLNINDAEEIAVGVLHTCARLSDNTLKCWGNNTNGRLGDGTVTHRSSPVTVSGVTAATQIRIGADASCAVLSGGVLKCWGNNDFGKLGDQTFTSRSTAITVPNIANASQVSVGADHVCVLLLDSSVKCWGINSYGQLGDGSSNDRPLSSIISGVAAATQVTMGISHSCALISGGTIKCWGQNANRQYGDSTFLNSDSAVTTSGINTATQVQAGSVHNCALLSTGVINCWGTNAYGQLGDGSTSTRASPVAVTGVTGATQIAVGEFFSCALLSTGSIKCWGRNLYGQLGDGNSGVNSLTAVDVSGITTAIQIAAGQEHGCALLNDGSIKCWGYNNFGQLGNGNTTNQLTPVSVSGISNATQLSLGSAHSCALLTGGSVKCWGSNSSGRLGDGTGANSSVPVLAGLATVTQIALTTSSGCALLSSGNVACWGSNANGQIGNISFSSTGVGGPVYRDLNQTAISVGSGPSAQHHCVVTSAGTVSCSGMNNYMQSGYNELNHRTVSGL